MNHLLYYKQYFYVGLKNAIEYKYNVIASIFTQIASIAVLYLIWAQLFLAGYVTSIKGFTLIDFLIYYIISMWIMKFTARVDFDFEEDINSGYLLIYIIQNLNPFPEYYFKRFGVSFFANITLFVLFLITSLVLHKFYILNFLLLLLFIILAAILDTLFVSLLSLVAVKIQRLGGFMFVVNMIVGFVSGALIPLNLFSIQTQTIFYFLPFQYMRYFPAVIFLGKVPTNQIIFGLISAIIWIVILYLLFKFFYKRALKSFEALGG